MEEVNLLDDGVVAGAVQLGMEVGEQNARV